MTPRSLLHFMAGGLCLAAACLPLSAQETAPQNFSAPKNGVNGASIATAAPQPWHESAPAKRLFLEIKDGVLTVDGLTAKVQLNHEIKDQGYLYFFMPGEGTAVVSLVSMSDSVLVKNAIHDKRMQFSADGHEFTLDSSIPLLMGGLVTDKKGREKKVAKDAATDVYVRFDRTAGALGRTPMFGYGTTTRAPYNWPLSLPEPAEAKGGTADAPPLPKDVLPRVVQVSSLSTSSRELRR